MTRVEALARVRNELAANGLPDPDFEARWLVCEAAAIRPVVLATEGDAPLGAEAAARLAAWTERRIGREPLTRIVGRRAFWTLDLTVTPDVLDPRPDSETVVETALALVERTASLRILDLGTGSGALLCALLAECPNATGIGVERSPAACAVARANAAENGLAARLVVVEADWSALPALGRFDLLVSNPPYIETATIATLDPEVRDHDPHEALDGGPDGLDAYRDLAERLPDLLQPDGVAVWEIGAGQSEVVTALMAAQGFDRVAARSDLGGHLRALAFRVRQK